MNSSISDYQQLFLQVNCLLNVGDTQSPSPQPARPGTRVAPARPCAYRTAELRRRLLHRTPKYDNNDDFSRIAFTGDCCD